MYGQIISVVNELVDFNGELRCTWMASALLPLWKDSSPSSEPTTLRFHLVQSRGENVFLLPEYLTNASLSAALGLFLPGVVSHRVSKARVVITSGRGLDCQAIFVSIFAVHSAVHASL